jgi:hypothetical protein
MKLRRPALKVSAWSSRAHGHGHVLSAGGQRTGHVFLDCDVAVQRQVMCQIDDAESALTDDRDDLELVQPRARRKCVGVLSEQVCTLAAAPGGNAPGLSAISVVFGRVHGA